MAHFLLTCSIALYKESMYRWDRASTWKPFEPSKGQTFHLFGTIWATWNYRETLNLPQQNSMTKWRFRCNRRLSWFLNLLITAVVVFRWRVMLTRRRKVLRLKKKDRVVGFEWKTFEAEGNSQIIDYSTATAGIAEKKAWIFQVFFR